ncbi:MAG: diaminopimelate epimerase [Methylophilaceae bacterium]|jgi:diaminopimelate epimerase|nr:diaminopimelate epimerase [Methylophilaceae bacterium]|tara:strand:+ start:29581 stop:30411 length:831 start_codon:yes stop_codon:yes gene_type:complete
MKVNFTKMQGIGNDFVVIDRVTTSITLTTTQIQHIANRFFGVGCDQLLMVEKSDTANVDFRYRIFNADGGEVEHCGNGARCFVRFVVDKGLTKKHQITVETASGIIILKLQPNGDVVVDMGPPNLEPDSLPFLAAQRQPQYTLRLTDGVIPVSAVSMGNPHAVVLVDNVETAAVSKLGPQIESHSQFPQHVNAGFMQVVNSHEINLRVYERGSGETLACGTGACAAVVSGIQLNLLQSPVLVNMRGGQLQIEWAGETQSVMMTGPAEIVFEGQIEL